MGFIINLVKNNVFLFVFLLIAIILTIILMFTTVFIKELVLESTLPLSGKIESINSREAISFYFAEKIDKKTVEITVNPEVKLFTEVHNSGEKSVLTVSPNPWWNFDKEYEITISKKLTGTSGAKLNLPITYRFTLVSPPPENFPVIP